MGISTFIQKYQWLKHTNSVEEYLPPEYYKRLLRPYTFGGISDLQLLEDFLKDKNASSILELGCGSGRASDVVVRLISQATYTFSDLSERMLGAAKKHLPNQSSFVVSDAVKFMADTVEQYDLVYTLWSFSHSTHQHVHCLGIEKAGQYISSVIKKFIRKNIRPNGSFFLIHFDSLSDEQRILMRQWKRVFPAFANTEQQSPSKQIIDRALLDLDNEGVITLSLNHLCGDSITYASENDVLETFMNFHLETYFNTLPIVADVVEDIRSQAEKYRNVDGSYSIALGCYVYSFIKN
ncbi:MAG: methyltransferase domain-containing protein [bacterium]